MPAYMPSLTIVGYGIDMAPQLGEDSDNNIRAWIKANFKSIDVVDSIIDNTEV